MKKPVTQDLPGVEGPGVSLPKFKDLDRLGDKFTSVRDEKAELAAKLGDIEASIAAKMVEHGLTKYKFSDQEIILKPGKTHIKIKTVKAVSDEDGADSADNESLDH